MKAKQWRIAIMTLATGALGVFPGSAQATTTTAYEMFGGGTLNAASCAPANACTPGMGFGAGSDQTTWTFGDIQGNQGGLIIPGSGVLLGEPVAGTYDCSSSTVTTTGGAQNFTLDWTFTCNKTQGVGPDPITGHFGSLAAGTFVWPGYFQINNDPNATAQATCSGGFIPRTLNGQSMTSVFFGGECTADPR